MTTSHICLAALLSALPLFAQNPTVDMNLWTVEDINGAGPWTIDAQRLWAETTNTVNTDCSVFYSDFDVTFLEFRMRIDASGGDDDLPGFVLGWQPGDSVNATADFLVVDWKRLTQNYQDWGTSNMGLAISRQTGPITRGYGNGPIDLWSHTINCTELQRGATLGSTGWAFNTDYHFRVIYTPGSVDIWLNGVHEFSLTGTFTPGRFGCYNYSQSKTGFQFPIQGAFNLFGTGCPGTAGTPYMFCPVTPNVGSSLPLITANLNPGALPLTLVGASRSNLGGAPLPIDLAAYGAAGCSLFVSADLLMFSTNYLGTAYTTFQLPASLPPSSTPILFVQSMILDPTANTLGVLMSNAGEIAVGIR